MQQCEPDGFFHLREQFHQNVVRLQKLQKILENVMQKRHEDIIEDNETNINARSEIYLKFWMPYFTETNLLDKIGKNEKSSFDLSRIKHGLDSLVQDYINTYEFKELINWSQIQNEYHNICIVSSNINPLITDDQLSEQYFRILRLLRLRDLVDEHGTKFPTYRSDPKTSYNITKYNTTEYKNEEYVINKIAIAVYKDQLFVYQELNSEHGLQMLVIYDKTKDNMAQTMSRVFERKRNANHFGFAVFENNLYSILTNKTLQISPITPEFDYNLMKLSISDAETSDRYSNRTVVRSLTINQHGIYVLQDKEHLYLKKFDLNPKNIEAVIYHRTVLDCPIFDISHKKTIPISSNSNDIYVCDSSQFRSLEQRSKYVYTEHNAYSGIQVYDKDLQKKGKIQLETNSQIGVISVNDKNIALVLYSVEDETFKLQVWQLKNVNIKKPTILDKNIFDIQLEKTSSYPLDNFQVVLTPENELFVLNKSKKEVQKYCSVGISTWVPITPSANVESLDG